MARARGDGHRCAECGATASKWVGRCEGCGGWGTLVPVDAASPGRPMAPARPIGEVDEVSRAPRSSGSAEVDRVTNGGFVPGSLTLLAGEPGIGKSTLALQLAAQASQRGRRALYLTAEESPSQVRQRAERLGALCPELWLAAAGDVDAAIAEIERLRPGLVVVDSIQTVMVAEVGAIAGSVTQVRASALRLADAARATGAAILLIGHVTKDGSLAGPRQLEHLVDTVLSFEGDRHHALRLLRAHKHRFGPTSELGLFEMMQCGLVDVDDPSGLLLADRRAGAAGSVVFPMVDGQRPLLVELQSLVVAGAGAAGPRRSAEGVDGGRLGLLLAVLGRVLDVPVLTAEVYCLAVGGVTVQDPGADLALVCAIVSSLTGRPLPADTVICGEVGLGGEVRSVRHSERRLAEAARAGFRKAIVPVNSPDVSPLALSRVRTVGEALLAVGLAPSGPPSRGGEAVGHRRSSTDEGPTAGNHGR